MKKLLLLFVLLATIDVAQNKITVEDIWLKYSFMPASPDGYNAMNDGVHYTDLEQVVESYDLVKYEIKLRKKDWRSHPRARSPSFRQSPYA